MTEMHLLSDRNSSIFGQSYNKTLRCPRGYNARMYSQIGLEKRSKGGPVFDVGPREEAATIQVLIGDTGSLVLLETRGRPYVIDKQTFLDLHLGLQMVHNQAKFLVYATHLGNIDANIQGGNNPAVMQRLHVLKSDNLTLI